MSTSSAYCIYVYAAVDDCQSTETEDVMKAMLKKTMTVAVMAAVVGCGGFYAPVASAVTLNCIYHNIHTNTSRKIGYVEYSKLTFTKLNPHDRSANPLGKYSFTIKARAFENRYASVGYYKYTLPNGTRSPTKKLLTIWYYTSDQSAKTITTPIVRKNSANINIWGDLRDTRNVFQGHCR